MRKTQDEHPQETIKERQSGKSDLSSNVMLEHPVELARQGLHGTVIFLCRNQKDDVVCQVLAVTQEKDSQDGYHQDSRRDAGGKAADLLHGTLDHRAMLLQEGLDAIGLGIAPTEIASEVIGDLPGGNPVRNGREGVHEPSRISLKLRSEAINEQENRGHKRQISFEDAGSTEVFEKQGVALEEPDDGVDQVSEEDGEGKDDEDRPRDIDNRETNRENGDGQQDFYRPVIQEFHKPPARLNSSGFRVSS